MNLPKLGGAHLIVTIAGDLDARLPHFHVHHQTFHHRQRVLVVTEVLRQNKAKRRERRRELFEPQRQERQISGVVTTLSDKINQLQNGTEQKEESQEGISFSVRSTLTQVTGRILTASRFMMV